MRFQSIAASLTDTVRFGVALSAMAACLMAAAPPLLLRQGLHVPALALYAGFASICHQIPDRSLEWLGFPLPLCARCTGLLLGFAAGALWDLRRLGKVLSLLPSRGSILAAGALLALDFLAPFLGLYRNTLATRLGTGMIFGFVIVIAVLSGITELLEMTLGVSKRKELA